MDRATVKHDRFGDGFERMLSPLEGAKFVAERSRDVKVKEDGVQSTADKLLKLLIDQDPSLLLKRFKMHELNPKTTDRAAVDWIFFSDVMNFSFWSDDPAKKFSVKYNGKTWTGYWALCAAMNRAIDEGVPLTDPQFYSSITLRQLQHILRSDSPYDMPLLQERLQVLHEAGNTLIQDYGGSYVTLVRQCGHSAVTLMQRTVAAFPSFRDQAEYDGKTIAINKRVQILIGDIWACCEGEGYGKFTDIDDVTMFADYRIPQALVWFGVMEYSDSLMETLKKGELLPNGDRREVEIRACSIWAVELIVRALRAAVRARADLPQDLAVNSVIIDHYMWDYRRDHMTETDAVPFHRTRSIYY